MAVLPPPPDGVDLEQDRRADIISAAFITWALALICVGLRILSRRMKRVDLWIDDWFIIASIPASCAHVFGMAVYGVSRGLGRHIWVNPPDASKAWAISLFIAELAYFITIACVKWSILAFYWRSFKIRQSIKIPIYTLAVIVLLWLVAVILVTVLQCQPTRAWWARFDPVDPLSPSEYTCKVVPVKFFYGNAIPTIVTDVLILLLPAPYVWSLQLPRMQKLALAGIFLVGLFVTTVSVVRLNYLLKGDLTDVDITWNFVDIGLWSVVEGNTAIVCACLPFLRPLIGKLTFGLVHMSSDKSGGTQGASTSRFGQHSELQRKHSSFALQTAGKPGQQSTRARDFGSRASGDEHPFARLPDDAKSHGGMTTDIRGKNSSTGSFELKGSPDGSSSSLEGVVITREIHVHHDKV